MSYLKLLIRVLFFGQQIKLEQDTLEWPKVMQMYVYSSITGYYNSHREMGKTRSVVNKFSNEIIYLEV